MQKQKKRNSLILSLGLSLALTTNPSVVTSLSALPVIAESTSESELPDFPLPQTVQSDAKIRIDGSVDLAIINQSLKDKFEQQFSGTQVEIGVNGTDAAIKALLNGEIDIAALGRGLTPEEKAQGLKQVRLRREKIAIIVSTNNPFQGELTTEQFAKIFRGEITDWSEIGGSPGKIRFIDHSPNSDTRNSFRDYPVFQSSQFPTGNNAIQQDNYKANQIIQELGTNGISYVIANQVSKIPDVRILKVEGITPDDPKYPFSQPLVYVYKENPNSAVASFLGFTLAPVGEETIEAAKDAEASAIAARALQTLNTQTATNPTSETQAVATATETENVQNTVNSNNEQQFVNPVENNPLQDKNIIFLMALLVPIIGFGSFFAWWLNRKQSQTDQTIETSATALTAITPNTETTPTDTNEYIDIDPFENSAPTNSTSDSQTTITSEYTEDNLVYISAESPTNNLTKTVTSKNTAPEIVEKHSSEQIINLDCGEVVWDTEAPVAVVNTPYPSVHNLPEIKFSNAEISTYELTNSLLELLNEPTELHSQDSSNSLSEILEKSESPNQHTNTSLSELLDESGELSTEETSKSLSEILNGTTASEIQDNKTSLSELLDESGELSPQEPSISLSELLNVKAELPTEDPKTLLSELLNETAASLAQDTSNSLSEALGIVAKNTDLQSGNSLSELLDVATNSDTPNSSELTPTSEIVSTDKFNPESISSLSELLGFFSEREELDLELVKDEAQQLLSEVSDQLEEVFNTVIGQAELNADVAKELSVNLATPSNSPDTIINNLSLEIEATPENPENLDILADHSPSDLQTQTQNTEIIINSDISEDSSIVFTPRTPKWAYVSWYVSETQKEAAQKMGGTTLAIRVYDATDIDLSYQTPQLVQQYECEEVICDSYVAIPTSNRDYITEIGYITNNNGWLCIARSGTVRIFSRPGTDFWFVADTELVIHGSTEPGATVTIGGHKIKLQPDGTFHLRVPFSDKLLNYLITASAANGENSITILKKFFHETSES